MQHSKSVDIFTVHLHSDACLSLYLAAAEFYLIIQFYLCLHSTNVGLEDYIDITCA